MKFGLGVTRGAAAPGTPHSLAAPHGGVQEGHEQAVSLWAAFLMGFQIF